MKRSSSHVFSEIGLLLVYPLALLILWGVVQTNILARDPLGEGNSKYIIAAPLGGIAWWVSYVAGLKAAQSSGEPFAIICLSLTGYLVGMAVCALVLFALGQWRQRPDKNQPR